MKETPLYYLFNQYELLGDNPDQWERFEEAVSQTLGRMEEKREICRLNVPAYRNAPEQDSLNKVVDTLQELKNVVKLNKDFDKIVPLMDRLVKNEKTMDGAGGDDVAPSEDTADVIIERISKGLKDELLVTENYICLEDTVTAAAEGSLDENAYHRTLESIRNGFEARLEEYNNTLISEHEWTLETDLGDRLLLEGLETWIDVLDYFMDSPDIKDQEFVRKGLEEALEANRRLFMVQRLSIYVNQKSDLIKKAASRIS